MCDKHKKNERPLLKVFGQFLCFQGDGTMYVHTIPGLYVYTNKK